MIKANRVEADTQVGRDRDGPYGALATYREFESLLQSKAINARGGLKSSGARLARMYEIAEKKEPGKHGWSWLPSLGWSLPDWVRLLLWLTVAAGAAAGLFYLFSTVSNWFQGRIEP